MSANSLTVSNLYLTPFKKANVFSGAKNLKAAVSETYESLNPKAPQTLKKKNLPILEQSSSVKYQIH